MKALYELVNISKQGFHQWLDRQIGRAEEQAQLLPILHQIRGDHPHMSCRHMYTMLHPRYMGRDHFERFCYAEGFKVEVKRNRYKTTQSNGAYPFPNLLLGLDELSGVNQLWVSDITYFDMLEEVSYLTFILDIYNREIVGYYASQSLRTVDTTLPALKMAIKYRQIKKELGLILHSDGGGQYYSKAFTDLTGKYNISNSMGRSAYENPYAERVNGIIKNDYLIPYAPKTFMELQMKLKKAVCLYNQEKPHSSLNKLTPLEFKNQVDSGILTKVWFINKKKKVTKKEKVNIIIR